MKKYISRFHYLTQDMPGHTHIEQADMACHAGANWIQYRCLSKTDEEMLAEIHHIAADCDDWGATLVLTNHYHLLDKADVQGVHIEDLNADLVAIRKAIGDDKTLGTSAINIADLLRIQSLGVVDYCSFGPFAHTDTLPNDYPLIGFNGYRELEKHLITIPVIAVGGIQLADVENLMATGIHGIAVSAAINLAVDPKAMVKAFYQKVY